MEKTTEETQKIEEPIVKLRELYMLKEGLSIKINILLKQRKEVSQKIQEIIGIDVSHLPTIKFK